jgi:ribonuclease HI
MKKLIIHSDGGARGNPGPAAIGVIITDEKGKLVDKISRSIGETTNNQAEYQAILAGLDLAHKLKAEEVHCYLDSELVVKQLRHEYKIKNKELAPLFVKVHNLSLQFKKITYTHIRREQNKAADKLVNEALDKE